MFNIPKGFLPDRSDPENRWTRTPTGNPLEDSGKPGPEAEWGLPLQRLRQSLRRRVVIAIDQPLKLFAAENLSTSMSQSRPVLDQLFPQPLAHHPKKE